MKIGVIIAMDIEYRQMHDAIGGDTGLLGNNEIVLWQCGIGKVNAAVGTMRLVQQHHPDVIISTGLAGGIDPLMKVMDVMAATQCVYHDVDCGGLGSVHGQVQGLPARYDAAQHLVDTALKVPREEGERLMTGLICTGDQFITNRDQLDIIKATYPDGLAVDMESAAIAQVCHLYSVPFVSFRIISDTPGAEEHFEEYLNFWQTMADKSFLVTRLFLSSL